MPSNTNSNPPKIEITLRNFPIRPIHSAAESIPQAIIKNGTASPAENMASSKAPLNAVAVVEASNKIEPKIGPMQGVHPKAKAEPRIIEFSGFPRSNILGAGSRFSIERNGIFIALSMKRPNIITKIPPILPSQIR